MGLACTHPKISEVDSTEFNLCTYVVSGVYERCSGNSQAKLSLVPMPFPPPVFDCLQYANAEGEGRPGRSGHLWLYQRVHTKVSCPTGKVRGIICLVTLHTILGTRQNFHQEHIEPAKPTREHVTTINGEIQTRLPDTNFSNIQIWKGSNVHMHS